MAGAGQVGATDFDPGQYGAAGFGMQDVAELQKRGHSYNEINDYANSRREAGHQVGAAVSEYQTAGARQEQKNQENKRAAKDRAQSYASSAASKREQNKSKFQAGQPTAAGTEQRSFSSGYQKGNYMDKKYDFN